MATHQLGNGASRPLPGPRNGDQIRAAYLNKLGIFPSSSVVNRSIPVSRTPKKATPPLPVKRRLPSDDSQCTLTTQGSSTLATLERSLSAESFTTYLDHEEPLKRHNEQEEYTKDRLVQFHSSVAVIHIPSHRDLSKEDRRSIWNSMRVLDQNAKRNVLEFIHDGWNWEQATEESAFVPTRKGKLLHPATWKAITRKEGERRRRKQQHPTSPIQQYNQNRFLLGPNPLTRFADT